MRVVAIIQARMGSSRLPGKVMMEVAGQPLLGHMLERVRCATMLDEVVVATTDKSIDDPIAQLAGKFCYRGSETDVLGRYFGAAVAFDADVVVRLTADCPLVDPAIIDQVVEGYLEGSYDYFSNTLDRGFPRGMDVEVFPFSVLEAIHRTVVADDEREHVTLHLYRHPERFRIGQFTYRMTVDVPEDLEIIEHLLASGQVALTDHLVSLYRNPQLAKLHGNKSASS